MESGQLLYDSDDPVGSRFGLDGAGILAYMVGDHLHPMMAVREDLWQSGVDWPAAARAHTRSVAALARLSPGDRVLDIGCGVGGPARQLVDECGVCVLGITTSKQHLTTARSLNEPRSAWRQRVEVALDDAQSLTVDGTLDAAIAINMIYHVADKPAMLHSVRDRLRVQGQLVIDDWMLTSANDLEAVRRLSEHWPSPHLAIPEILEQQLIDSGYAVDHVRDLGFVGRRVMGKHFESVFRRDVMPRIVADWPAGGTIDGLRMSEDFITAVSLTLDLYRQGRLTYRQIAARKR